MKLSSPFKSTDAPATQASSADTRREESFTVHLGILIHSLHVDVELLSEAAVELLASV